MSALNFKVLSFQAKARSVAGDWLTEAQDSGEQYMQRINDMLSVTKHAWQRAASAAAAVYDLRYELTGIYESFLDEASAKNIDFSMSIAEDMPVAFWDMQSLRQHLFDELLSNAIRCTPAGGKVGISVEKQDEYNLTIKIGDSGAGISAKALRASLFQTDAADAEITAPSGLSLMLSAVAAHKGTVRVITDEAFSGTVFMVTLPLYCLCMQ